MKCILFPGNQEIRIDAANLEEANLSEYNCLELHLLDSAAVVIPGEMTGKELLQHLSITDLQILLDSQRSSCSSLPQRIQRDFYHQLLNQ